MTEYEKQSMRLTNSTDYSLISVGASKSAVGQIIGKIISMIFKIALASAGLMVAGDVVNKIVGRPNSIDHTYQRDYSTPSGNSAETTNTNVSSTQNKYPLKSDAPLNGSFPITNTSDNIGNMIIQFAKDVYSGLDGKDNLIKSTARYNAIKEKIQFANAYNPGSSSILIPPIFTSKKQVVDYFIDDVANADTSTSSVNKTAPTTQV